MRHLVVGASGLVGGQILTRLAAMGRDAAGTFHRVPRPGLHPLDIRSESAVDALIGELQPGVIHLPASLTNVDECEKHPETAYAVNVLGVAHVVRAARESGAKLVYFSSDYLFDGTSGPYREDDAPHPINVYGQQKLMAEHQVALWAPEALIVRTTVVYGWEWQGKNFVARMLDTLRQGRSVRVPNDQVGSPTYGPDLAEAVIDLLDQGTSGVYNVCGRDRMSRFLFAREAARAFDLDPTRIQSVPTVELGQAALRPLDAGMVVEKVESKLGRHMTGVAEGLQAMVDSEGSL